MKCRQLSVERGFKDSCASKLRKEKSITHPSPAIMSSNLTGSPIQDHLKFCYLGGVLRNTSFTFNAVTITTSVVLAVLSPVAVVGNILIMAVIWRNQTLRTPSYILLSGLAFTDFCTGFITQPLFVASRFICFQSSLESNAPQLSFLPYNIAFSAGCSSYLNALTLLLITLMSIERWLYMTRRSLLTVRRSCFIMATMMVLLIPMAVVHSKHILKRISDPVSKTVSFVILLFCIITTSIAYCRVFKIIRRHQLQVTANEPSQNFGQPAINLAKYKKSVFTILYILGLLFASVLPLLVFVGLSLFSFNRSLLEIIFQIALTFSFLSSSLNPLMYLWRMNDIRNGVKQLSNHLLCRDG